MLHSEVRIIVNVSPVLVIPGEALLNIDTKLMFLIFQKTLLLILLVLETASLLGSFSLLLENMISEHVSDQG